ncbi:hypothetical protein NDU88_004043 [Pleurodeles waltl]|uniref:Uncharacterized protein n=1 Tax=Pleurodeles waltl TaxID=8319 RepID=A0AAV7UE89_PLEWA|nr:hypothetical protein NDU88_004043 [Pleurodeles waltl]
MVESGTSHQAAVAGHPPRLCVLLSSPQPGEATLTTITGFPAADLPPGFKPPQRASGTRTRPSAAAGALILMAGPSHPTEADLSSASHSPARWLQGILKEVALSKGEPYRAKSTRQPSQGCWSLGLPGTLVADAAH